MVYNGWFSVENRARCATFCIVAGGHGDDRGSGQCLSPVADSEGRWASSPNSERVSYYFNQDRHISSTTNKVRQRGETQAIHPSGVLPRSATTFACNGNSSTDDCISFEFDIIDFFLSAITTGSVDQMLHTFNDYSTFLLALIPMVQILYPVSLNYSLRSSLHLFLDLGYQLFIFQPWGCEPESHDRGIHISNSIHQLGIVETTTEAVNLPEHLRFLTTKFRRQ